MGSINIVTGYIQPLNLRVLAINVEVVVVDYNNDTVKTKGQVAIIDRDVTTIITRPNISLMKIGPCKHAR